MMHLPPKFSVIGAQVIKAAVDGDLPGCVSVIKEAYLAHDAGMTVNPSSVFLRFPDSPSARIIALPAHLRGEGAVSGIKWISSYPDNHRRKLPRASAVLILNDAETGFPMVCMEGSVISAARTAASATLAADVIRGGSRVVRSLGIVGAGLISRYVVKFLLGTGWSIQQLNVHDVDAGAAARFAAWARAGGNIPAVDVSTGIEQVCKDNDLVLIATVASLPHIKEPDWFGRGQTVLHLSLRDLAPGIIRLADNVVDDPAHVVAAGTSIALGAEEAGNTAFITGTLADLLLARKTLSREKATVFSPFGLGMLDLALGRWIYERAGADERRAIPDFFESH